MKEIGLERLVAPPPKVALGLIAVAWILPFIQHHHRLPLPSFLSEWIAVIAGLALCGYVLWHTRGKTLAVPPIVLMPLCMAALLAVHAMSGVAPYRHSAGVAVLYLAWACVLAMAGRWLARFDGDDTAARLSWCLLVGGAIAALVGMLQMFGVHTFLDAVVSRYNGRVSGNLGSPNHFALYVAMGVVSLIYLAACRRVLPVVALLLLVPLLFILAASGSRSGWIYVAVMVFVVGAWRVHRTDDAARRAVAWCATAVVAYIACNLGLSSGLFGQSGEGNSATRILAGSPFMDLRFGLWQFAIGMFLDRPLFGVGWGNFAWELFLRNDGRFWVGWDFDANAHNLFLHVLAETGLLGLAALLVPLAFWWKRAREGRRHASWYWGMALLLLIAVHAMLEYTLWYAYFLGIAALLLGWLDPGGQEDRAGGGSRLVPVVLLLAGGWVAGQALDDNQVLEKALDPSVLEAPGATPAIITDMVAMQRGSLLMPELERILGMGLLADAGRMSQTLGISDRVVRQAPTPEHVFRHAVLLQLAKQDEQAVRLFDHGLLLFGHLEGARQVASNMLAAGERHRAGAMAPLVQRLSAAPSRTPFAR